MQVPEGEGNFAKAPWGMTPAKQRAVRRKPGIWVSHRKNTEDGSAGFMTDQVS